MHMTLRLFILIGILYCNNVSAQNCLVEIKHSMFANSDDIINGTKWIYEKRYLGSPMIMEKYWPKADILYNGVHFNGVLMNYNVYGDEIIIFHPEKGKEKYVVISKDKLSGFSFTDTITNRKHIYEYIELPGIRGRALYENARVGKTLLYIKPMKKIDVRTSKGLQGEFSDYFEYYLKTGEGFTEFKSKSQLITLLSNHSIELNRFIRKNKLKINSQHPENIIKVLNFFDGFK
jgi:hypothetical protein